MSKYTGPKCRQYRKVGLRLQTHGEISQNHPTIKKSYKPGQHGPKGTFGKKSEYAKQLLEKQKARIIYNVSEKQFHKYYVAASKKTGITADEMLTLLETRLDNVIFRSGLAKTRYQARQMVNHGLIEFNGRRVTIPSIQVKAGDKFNLVSSKKESALFKENSMRKVKAPKWLSVDLKGMKGEVSRKPDASELEQAIAGNMIVEFYSK